MEKFTQYDNFDSSPPIEEGTKLSRLRRDCRSCSTGFKFLKKEEISKTPKTAGVYAFFEKGEFLYIGKAANLRERIKNHFHPVKYREAVIPPKAKLFNRVKQIGFIETDSEIEALILEANLIKKYQPKYNVVWRDDKNYFFVGITKEDFPRVFIIHQIQKSKFKINYIGPFIDGGALKQTLKILRKVFPYRSCKKIPNRPCLWYHLGRCPAPCLLKSNIIKEVSPDVLKIKKLSQRNARNLIKILKEGKSKVLKDLKREMKFLAKSQEFEEAAKIRNQITALERVIEHAKIFEPSLIREITPWCKLYNRIERKLRKIIKTKNKISRIEAYDVSNIVGQQATGSMVTFINGLPDKNFYRRFRIHPVKSPVKFAESKIFNRGAKQFNRVKIAEKPNDIAMLKEVLSRRSKHKEWSFPDLILIDGGKAQLNAGRQCLTPGVKHRGRKIIVMALAKKENKLFVEGQKKPLLLKNLPREIFNLILQLRDEAHRFARKYHLKLREFAIFPKP